MKRWRRRELASSPASVEHGASVLTRSPRSETTSSASLSADDALAASKSFVKQATRTRTAADAGAGSASTLPCCDARPGGPLHSKFDHIVDSDDEDNESKARDALLIDKKQRHHFERDAELTQARRTARAPQEQVPGRAPQAGGAVHRDLRPRRRAEQRVPVLRHDRIDPAAHGRAAAALVDHDAVRAAQGAAGGHQGPGEQGERAGGRGEDGDGGDQHPRGVLTEGAPTKLFEALCSSSSKGRSSCGSGMRSRSTQSRR